MFLVATAIVGAFTGPAGWTLGWTLWLLLWFALEWFYGGVLEAYWNGQTLGKRLMGIRVLRTDGQPINGLQAVMRNFLRLVDLMPFLPLGALVGQEGPWALPTGLLGLVVPMLNERFQRLGDLACGTMVVVEERGWLLSAVRLEDPRVPRLAAELPPNFQVVGKLPQALAAYAERRQYLSPARREEIARHLGEPLLPRLGLLPDTSHDLLLCALYYRTFVVSRTASEPEQTSMSRLLEQPGSRPLSSVVAR